jgi:hypothetical protein
MKCRDGIFLFCFLSITVALHTMWLYEYTIYYQVISSFSFSNMCILTLLSGDVCFVSLELCHMVWFPAHHYLLTHNKPLRHQYHAKNSQFLTIKIYVHFRKYRLHRKVPKYPAEHPYPGVSVLKPLMGVDPHLLGNLETFFTLTYPKVSIPLISLYQVFEMLKFYLCPNSLNCWFAWRTRAIQPSWLPRVWLRNTLAWMPNCLLVSPCAMLEFRLALTPIFVLSSKVAKTLVSIQKSTTCNPATKRPSTNSLWSQIVELEVCY